MNSLCDPYVLYAFPERLLTPTYNIASCFPLRLSCVFFHIIASFREKEMIPRIKISLVFKFEMSVGYPIAFKKDQQQTVLRW